MESSPKEDFFHHPTWPERWSHPGFQDMDQWDHQPWFDENQRLATILLKRCMLDACLPWGYIIYRTIYTQESDELWSSAMAKFTDWMHREIDANGEFGDARIPEKLVHESYRDVIIEGKEQWDGASIDQIREHFTNSVDCKDPYPRFQVCLLIDGPAFRSIIAAPDPKEWQPGMRKPFVGMIDGRYQDYSAAAKKYYPAYFRVELGNLYFLFIELAWGTSLDELVYSVPPEFIPVYDGVNGSAQDQEGNEKLFPMRGGGRR